MTRILLISNGHGEDLSGSLIGDSLIRQNHKVDALPIVGLGKAYKKSGIKVIRTVREFSTGGIGYTSLIGRLTELIEGQLIYLLEGLICLMKNKNNYDLIVIVGDIIPIIYAWISKLPTVTYLVAYSSHYEGRLRLPWPCNNFLSSKRFLKIYARDKLTAEDLSTQLRRKVEFQGNPFLDPVSQLSSNINKALNYIGMLPGSRRPELDFNVKLMLRVVSFMPENFIVGNNILFNMALVDQLNNEDFIEIASSANWQLISNDKGILKIQYINSEVYINVYRNSFVKILQSSKLLVSMAGTATEQSVGIGKPVIQIIGKGPQFTESFAEAQRRLLGPTVFVADGKPISETNLTNTALLIMEIFKRASLDKGLDFECKKQALERIGRSGGTERIANDIRVLINNFTFN